MATEQTVGWTPELVWTVWRRQYFALTGNRITDRSVRSLLSIPRTVPAGGAYEVLVRIDDDLEDLLVKWKNNIKMDFGETGWVCGLDLSDSG